MNEDCVRYYTAQIIDAVSFMHDNGIVHRDLKPENILIDSQMKVQITDFGTAKILEKRESDGKYPADVRATSFVGTAEYVSPELLNDKYAGKPGDVWAIGCVLYQMIAGRPPFKATNEYLTFQKICKLQYAFSAGFPTVVRDLVKRILVLKPRDRLTLPQVKQHYFFKDIDFDDEQMIWGRNPPELGPYKMSAKSMMSVPDLNKPYPSNVSAVMPKRPSTGTSGGAESKSAGTASNSNNNSSTVSISTSGVLGNGQTTLFGLPLPQSMTAGSDSPAMANSTSVVTSAQSAAAAMANSKKVQVGKVRSGSASNTTNNNTATGTANTSTPPNSSARPHSRQASGTTVTPVLTKSASTAAQAAIAHINSTSNIKRKVTSQQQQSQSQVKVTSTSSESLVNSSSTSSSLLDQVPPSPVTPTPGSASNSVPATPRGRHSSSGSANGSTSALRAAQPIEYIPGTNIPRPVLNTRNPSKFNRSTTRSSFNVCTRPELGSIFETS
ncbi:unnamed protein product [Ambrosiozyma monospora]|uniref:Unnamed protein product n=1 Tax=Ambrosiozyma monospora TaxID=43982 RepID=A0ACB5U1E6_AMBMO|nr:unnamed protein product [Ambrosiozyma monospora]